MDLNVKSVFFLTQRLIKLLEAAGSPESYSRVINIGSIEGNPYNSSGGIFVCCIKGRS